MSWIPIAVAAGVTLLVALWVALTYNRLRALQYACDDAWSLVDVQLQRRADLVPNLVTVVQAYAAHERAVLEAVTEARARAAALHDPSPATAAAEARLGSSINSALALQETYPDLKASEQFLQLQRTIADAEDQIAASREIYNGNVAAYRNLIQQVPSNWVAGQFGFADRSMFAAPNLQDFRHPA
ncbi:MAG: LemA family protein [Solirubrobacteraceae bacterium]|nr:LemA family protein [Solirubrobacteraceae bacterium]